MWFLIGTLVCAAALVAPAQELRVAAASDLAYALGELAPLFEKESGIRLRITHGSSGNFYSQIANGAPFDIFLSADVEYPRRLHTAGLADAPVVYGRGRIVLWSLRGGVDLGRGMQALLGAKRIAIANPHHAPYGRAAVEAMKKAGVYERVRDRLVLGENVSQAAQFVHSGAADVGVIALSLALSPALGEQGSAWEVPQDLYPPIEQAAAVVSKAAQGRAGHALLQYLKAPAAQAILRKYGFVP